MLNNLSKIALYVLIGISAVVTVLFFWGGNVEASAEYLEPTYTQELIMLMYAFIGIAFLVTLVSLLISFVLDLQSDVKTALKPVISIVALVVLLGLAWVFADGSSIQILGMDVQPSEADLKFVDMQIKSIYFLSGIAVLLMFLSFFTKRLK
ncbi:MAG: hypothetical protein KA298_05160 [Paludibacteraceae bacterium]|nr:hypothetical protein [Paludibacteraceae bacterium]